MKKGFTYLFFLAVMIFSSRDGAAQQMGIYTNYLLNEFYYNPAIAGSRDVFLANINYRNQWVGFNEAPRSYTASVYGSWKNRRKAGIGMSVVGERGGLTQRTGGYLTYAYHFSFTEKLRMGLGVSAGFLQYRVRLYDVRVVDSGDDLLSGNVMNANAPDLNAGLYLYHDKFWLGLSGFQLLKSKLQFANSNSNLIMHYYATGGINVKVNKKNVIQPSFMLRYSEPVPYQFDASLRWLYNKMFWLGVSYRTDDAYCAMLGFNYKDRINFGYSYDYTFSNIQKYSTGSHEIWLSYTINKKKKTLDEEDEEINNGVHDLFKQQNQKKQNENEPNK